MTDIDPEVAGYIARVAADKAERSIGRLTLHPADVIRFRQADDFGPAEAIVHMDGDPADVLQAVKVASGIELLPGIRAAVTYNPPHQAIALGPIGLLRTPSGRLTDNCSGGSG